MRCGLKPQTGSRTRLRAPTCTIHNESNPTTLTRKGMGTTCTALLLQNGFAYSAHVGDSRLYLIRNDAIYLMTEDHSAVMQLVKTGNSAYRRRAII